MVRKLTKTRKTKAKRASKKVSYVAFVLDKSGSMESIRKETVEAFNQQVEDVKRNSKKNKIKAKVSFVTFNTAVDEPTLWLKSPEDLKPLTLDEYRPDGYTAMLDGVGTTIDKLLEQEDVKSGKASVLMIIVSDGQENNSKEYNYQTLAAKIKELNTKGNWTFTYSGANQDLSQVSAQLNIPLGNMQAFKATAAGMKGATIGRTLSTDAYFQSYGASVGSSFNVRNFYNQNQTDEEDQSSDQK